MKELGKMGNATTSKTRSPETIRPTTIIPNWQSNAEGSALISMGRTRVLCTATVDTLVPTFAKDKGQGWITAEYGMLPRSTLVRTQREAAKGKQSGRTLEISRLIGRSLRAAIRLERLEGYSIIIDCDVLEADGGTRCASITGGMVALTLALTWLEREEGMRPGSLTPDYFIAALSCGVVDGQNYLDLDYDLDHRADCDMNVVMDNCGRYVELQCTAEGTPITAETIDRLRQMAKNGIQQLLTLQEKACGVTSLANYLNR